MDPRSQVPRTDPPPPEEVFTGPEGPGAHHVSDSLRAHLQDRGDLGHGEVLFAGVVCAFLCRLGTGGMTSLVGFSILGHLWVYVYENTRAVKGRGDLYEKGGGGPSYGKAEERRNDEHDLRPSS